MQAFARYFAQMSETFPPSSPAANARRDLAASKAKWRALQETTNAVAGLAGNHADTLGAELSDFPGMLAQTSGWRRILAEDGLDDLLAMVQPGLAALLASQARGHDPAGAATILWREIILARGTLLDLVAPMELPSEIAEDTASVARS